MQLAKEQEKEKEHHVTKPLTFICTITSSGTHCTWILRRRLHHHAKYTGNGNSGDDGRLQTLDFPPIDRARGEPLIDRLRIVARRHHATPAQIAIAWLLHQPVVTSVILGAKSVEQLSANVEATSIALDITDLSELNQASALPIEYPGWLLGHLGERLG